MPILPVFLPLTEKGRKVRPFLFLQFYLLKFMRQRVHARFSFLPLVLLTTLADAGLLGWRFPFHFIE